MKDEHMKRLHETPISFFGVATYVKCVFILWIKVEFRKEKNYVTNSISSLVPTVTNEELGFQSKEDWKTLDHKYLLGIAHLISCCDR